MILQPSSTRFICFTSAKSLSLLPTRCPTRQVLPVRLREPCMVTEGTLRKTNRPVTLQNAENHGIERSLCGSSNSKTHLSLKARTNFSGKKSFYFLMRVQEQRISGLSTEHV